MYSFEYLLGSHMIKNNLFGYQHADFLEGAIPVVGDVLLNI
jgi:hypothetical protein